MLDIVGREFDRMDRTVTVDPPDDAGNANGSSPHLCTVSTADRSWIVAVTVGREVPTIACRQPGGLPVKAGVEYRVTSIAER